MIKDYIKYVSYLLLGIIFVLGSFYLVSNYYHYKEIRRVYNKGKDETVYNDITKNINSIKNVVLDFDVNNYKGKYSLKDAKERFDAVNSCTDLLNNKVFLKFSGKRDVDLKDLYELNDSLLSFVISDCFVNHLDKIDVDNLNIIMTLVSNNTTYIKNELLNNSSIYFNTNTNNSLIRDNVRSTYSMIMASYNTVSDLLLNIAKDTLGDSYE